MDAFIQTGSLRARVQISDDEFDEDDDADFSSSALASDLDDDDDDDDWLDSDDDMGVTSIFTPVSDEKKRRGKRSPAPTAPGIPAEIDTRDQERLGQWYRFMALGSFDDLIELLLIFATKPLGEWHRPFEEMPKSRVHWLHPIEQDDTIIAKEKLDPDRLTEYDRCLWVQKPESREVPLHQRREQFCDLLNPTIPETLRVAAEKEAEHKNRMERNRRETSRGGGGGRGLSSGGSGMIGGGRHDSRGASDFGWLMQKSGMYVSNRQLFVPPKEFLESEEKQQQPHPESTRKRFQQGSAFKQFSAEYGFDLIGLNESDEDRDSDDDDEDDSQSRKRRLSIEMEDADRDSDSDMDFDRKSQGLESVAVSLYQTQSTRELDIAGLKQAIELRTGSRRQIATDTNYVQKLFEIEEKLKSLSHTQFDDDFNVGKPLYTFTDSCLPLKVRSSRRKRRAQVIPERNLSKKKSYRNRQTLSEAEFSESVAYIAQRTAVNTAAAADGAGGGLSRAVTADSEDGGGSIAVDDASVYGDDILGRPITPAASLIHRIDGGFINHDNGKHDVEPMDENERYLRSDVTYLDWMRDDSEVQSVLQKRRLDTVPFYQSIYVRTLKILCEFSECTRELFIFMAHGRIRPIDLYLYSWEWYFVFLFKRKPKSSLELIKKSMKDTTGNHSTKNNNHQKNNNNNNNNLNESAMVKYENMCRNTAKMVQYTLRTAISKAYRMIYDKPLYTFDDPKSGLKEWMNFSQLECRNKTMAFLCAQKRQRFALMRHPLWVCYARRRVKLGSIILSTRKGNDKSGELMICKPFYEMNKWFEELNPRRWLEDDFEFFAKFYDHTYTGRTTSIVSRANTLQPSGGFNAAAAAGVATGASSSSSSSVFNEATENFTTVYSDDDDDQLRLKGAGRPGYVTGATIDTSDIPGGISGRDRFAPGLRASITAVEEFTSQMEERGRGGNRNKSKVDKPLWFFDAFPRVPTHYSRSMIGGSGSSSVSVSSTHTSSSLGGGVSSVSSSRLSTHIKPGIKLMRSYGGTNIMNMGTDLEGFKFPVGLDLSFFLSKDSYNMNDEIDDYVFSQGSLRPVLSSENSYVISGSRMSGSMKEQFEFEMTSDVSDSEDNSQEEGITQRKDDAKDDDGEADDEYDSEYESSSDGFDSFLKPFDFESSMKTDEINFRRSLATISNCIDFSIHAKFAQPWLYKDTGALCERIRRANQRREDSAGAQGGFGGGVSGDPKMGNDLEFGLMDVGHAMDVSRDILSKANVNEGSDKVLQKWHSVWFLEEASKYLSLDKSWYEDCDCESMRNNGLVKNFGNWFKKPWNVAVNESNKFWDFSDDRFTFLSYVYECVKDLDYSGLIPGNEDDDSKQDGKDEEVSSSFRFRSKSEEETSAVTSSEDMTDLSRIDAPKPGSILNQRSDNSMFIPKELIIGDLRSKEYYIFAMGILNRMDSIREPITSEEALRGRSGYDSDSRSTSVSSAGMIGRGMELNSMNSMPHRLTDFIEKSEMRRSTRYANAFAHVSQIHWPKESVDELLYDPTGRWFSEWLDGEDGGSLVVKKPPEMMDRQSHYYGRGHDYFGKEAVEISEAEAAHRFDAEINDERGLKYITPLCRRPLIEVVVPSMVRAIGGTVPGDEDYSDTNTSESGSISTSEDDNSEQGSQQGTGDGTSLMDDGNNEDDDDEKASLVLDDEQTPLVSQDTSDMMGVIPVTAADGTPVDSVAEEDDPFF